MMNKLGALLFAAVAAQALPVNAQDASRTASSPGAQAIASQTPNDAADSDATGSIGKRAQPAVTASPFDAGRAAPAQGQGKPPVTYAEAFRNWRTCAVQHQTVGNPPPQCEPLRLALKQAIALRPRYKSADARSRN
jgi:hypothetical protein